MLFYLALIIQLFVLSGITWCIYVALSLDQAFYDKSRAKAIDVLGNFMADLLDHPRVKVALAQVVTNGMNHTLEQPDLGQRIAHVGEALREDNLKMSRSIGEQLPGLAANFMGGAMSSLKRGGTKGRTEASFTDSKHSTDVLRLRLDGSEESVSDKKKI